MKSNELENATLKALTEGFKKTKSKKIEKVESSSDRFSLKVDKRDNAWIIGNATIDGKNYEINAKVFDKGSDYGIDKGPVSKLWIKDTNSNARCIVNFDRSWDVKPTDENKEVYNKVLNAVIDFRKANPIDVKEECVKTESKKVEEVVKFTAYGKTYYEMSEDEYDNKSDEEIQATIEDTANQATEEEGHTVETDEVEILFESKEIKTESYNNDELKELLNKGEILKVGQTQFKIDNGEVYFNDPSWTFGWDKHNGLSNVDELVNHLSNLQSDKYKITVEPKEKKEKTSDEMYELTKNTKVKDWYKDTFPDDELGNDINPNITFYDVFETLDHYKDIYELLGVDDSAIRERVFYGLDDMIDEPHGYSYEQWQLASKTTESKEIKTESDTINVEDDISETFNPSYKAFENNFGKIYIVKDKYDKLYKVYKEDKLNLDDYIYYGDNKDQIIGFLDGAIKANNGIFNK